MKNILVATDFSNNAYCALFYATKLLKSESCTFHLLNTFNELTLLEARVIPVFGGRKTIDQLQAESEEGLARTSNRIVLDNGNAKHTFNTLAKKGELVKTITEIIDKENIDLVIMGNKGLDEAADLFFGSNTIKVVNAMTKCPVLAIPGQLEFTSPEDIAFITDYKTGCHPESISPLLFLASLFNSTVRVMHINSGQVPSSLQETNRKQLEGCLKNTEHSFHEMSDLNDKAKIIDAFLDEMNVDLFSMAHNRRNLFQRLTREPVIKDVSMYSDVPFLILPDRKNQ